MIYQDAALTPLGEFLKAPEGYSLEHLVVTTYSLSGDALLSLAIAGYLASRGDDLDGLQLSEVVMEERPMRQWAGEHFTVFSQGCPTSGSNTVVWEQACALSDLCCVNVSSRGTFHPKLLLACFKGEGDWRYRLQVGSQNLGSHGGIELSICLESEPGADNPNGAELLRFFESFYCQTGRCAHLLGLAKVDFRRCRHPDDRYRLENVEFLFSDPGSKKLIDHLKSRFDNGGDWKGGLKVYSPFLTPDQSGAMYLDTKLKCPVRYYTNLTKSIDAKKGTTADIWCVAEENTFLHAKLYYRKKAEDTNTCTYHVLLGSANASANGLEHNVELMVGFDWIIDRYSDGRPVGPDDSWAEETGGATHYLKRLGNGASGYSFVSLHATTATPRDDDRERALHSMKQYLNGLKATAAPASGGGWDVKITATAASVAGLSIGITQVEGKAWNGQMVLQANELPCGKLLRVTVQARYNAEVLSVTGSVPLDVSAVAGNQGGNPMREPTPMLQLLTDFNARDAIPRCRKKGFANPNDDVMERLEGYFASWAGSGYEAQARDRLRLNVLCTVTSIMHDPESWDSVAIAPEEIKKLGRLWMLLEHREKGAK